MMNVMDLFRSASPAPAPATTNNGPAPAPAPDTNPGGANPPSPSPSPNAPAPPPANPLDIYSKIWDNPVEEGKAPVFNLDPAIMDKVVGAQDFMQGADPELMTRAQTGDTKAIMELIQYAGKQSYRAAMNHNSVLTGKFVEAREGYNEKNVNSRVRGELTNQSLADTPNFKNPVVRKQLTDTAERLQRQYPDAAPSEIAKMTKDYFQELVSAISPTPAARSNNAGNNEDIDWDNFFDKADSQQRS